MIYLLIALGVVVVLVVLYLVASRVKPFGQSLAFVCVVACRLLVTLAYHMENAAAYCKKACLASLRSITDTGDWNVYDVVKRVEHFIVGLFILLGETIQVMEIVPTLFPTALHVALPPVAELSSAALFICCSALFGEIMLECWGKIRGVGLFHNMGKPSRWILGIVAALLLVFSILVNGYFYVYRAAILDQDNTQGMSLYILGGLGLEVSAVSPFALLALTQGSVSVIAFLMWIAEKTCEMVGAVASFLPELLDVLALHLSHGTIGVGGRQIARPPHTYPPFSPSASLTALSSQTATALLPEHSLSFPSPKENEVTQMPKNVISVVSGGVYGTRCISPLVSAAHKVQLTPFSSASVDLTSLESMSFHLGVDCSLTYLEQMAVKACANNEKDAYTKMFTGVGQKLVNTHLPVQYTPGVVAAFLDRRIGSTAFPALRDINRRLPYHRIAVVTEIAETEKDQPDVQAFLQGLTQLQQEDVLKTTMVTSPRSKFALQHGVEKQSEFTMHAILSLLRSPSCVSVLDDLSTHSPFVSLSFATAPVALGDTPVRHFWLKWFTNKAVVGNVRDAITQAIHCSQRVLGDPETQAFDAGSQAFPCYLVYNCPFADGRFHEFRQSVTQAITSDFPLVKTLTVSGSGVPYLHPSPSPFLVQASRFSPVTMSVLTPDTKDKVKEPTVLVPSLSSEEKITLVPFTATPDKITKNSSNGTQRRGRGRASKKGEK